MSDLLTIKYLPLVEARKFDRNAKKHDISAIADSIARYGFKDPPKWEPTLNAGNGGIVEGNGRIEALTQLQEEGKEPPRGVAIADNGSWAIPIVFGVDSDSEAAARAYALDHNLLTMAGGEFTASDMSRMFDVDEYLKELNALSEEDELPISVDSDDLDLLLEELSQQRNEKGNSGSGNPDDVPNVDEAEPRCKSGELWQLGRHRLLVGDSTDGVQVKRLLGDRKADIFISDPPYNVDYDPEERPVTFGAKRRNNPFGTIANDKMTDSEFSEFLAKVFKNIDNNLNTGCPIYIFYADKKAYWFYGAFLAQGWKLQSSLVWKKEQITFGRTDYHYIHEPILYGWKEGEAHKYYGDRKQATVIEMPAPRYDTELDTDGQIHSCQKPVALIEVFLNNSSQKGDRVLDLFGGSGSTLIACERTGRNAYLMEMEQKFASAIIERWEKLTGKTAVKISG